MGCQASVNADARVSGKGAEARADAELSGSASGEIEGKGEMTRVEEGGPGRAGFISSAGASRVLLGARHDLKLRPGKGTASCECLSVALGMSRDGAMAWSAVPPDLDENTQLSLAFSSEGQACKGEPRESLGASYWGYRLSGNDVIVLVEAARGGRPLTNGAVIPKPVGTGQVYVAPASTKLPYGRSLAGNGLCKIGNPGRARTAPFSELEVGADAPPAPTGGVSRGAGDAPQNVEARAPVEWPGN